MNIAWSHTMKSQCSHCTLSEWDVEFLPQGMIWKIQWVCPFTLTLTFWALVFVVTYHTSPGALSFLGQSQTSNPGFDNCLHQDIVGKLPNLIYHYAKLHIIATFMRIDHGQELYMTQIFNSIKKIGNSTINRYNY